MTVRYAAGEAPLLEIALWTANGPVATTSGIVDSGAGASLFPIGVAHELGLIRSSLRAIGSGRCVGSRFRLLAPIVPVFGRVVARWDGEADLWGPVISMEPRFSRHDVVLLGRRDFFRAFVVTFDERAPAFHLAA